MSTLRVVGELPLPVDPAHAWEVFARVEDWPAWDWMGSRDAAWIDGDPWTVGARLRLGHRPFTFVGVVTVADPPRVVVWEAPGLGIQGHHAFRFPARPGGCAIRSEETFTGPGARLLRPLVRWYWRRQMLAFRRHLARTPPPGGGTPPESGVGRPPDPRGG
jgi:hypothetical protein